MRQFKQFFYALDTNKCGNFKVQLMNNWAAGLGKPPDTVGGMLTQWYVQFRTGLDEDAYS